jgi:hypothetical protein
MNRRTCTALIVVLLFAYASPVAAQAPLPAGWPNRLELGMGDTPGGAAFMKTTAPFAFRYQYLAGGANTGGGWATWSEFPGDFARFYIQDSVNNGIIPVFSYYMLLQSLPGGATDADAVFTNLNTTTTMTAYYNDLKLFFQKAATFPGQKVVLHVEPDFWGYMQQRATGDNATSVTAKVSETGLSDLAGLPSNLSGFARAIVKLRDTYGPNVILAYHLSVWGTGTDIALANPPDGTVDALAGRAAAFFNSLAASFDITFAEFSDRDAGFYQHVYNDGGAHWWDAEDYRRSARFLKSVSTATAKRLVMWQIPFGNTKMQAQDNTWGHYQDNRVEWLLDEAARTHLTAYRDAGVVAFLFDTAASGVTCACDGENDGVTNPAPINGNVIASQDGTGPPVLNNAGGTQTLVTPYAADDDGGYFRWRAWRYYQDGSMLLTPPPTPPPTPTGVRIVR